MDWSFVLLVLICGFWLGVFAVPAIAYLWLDFLDGGEDDEKEN